MDERLLYRPLEHSKHRFRLLGILDVGSDRIQCELSVFSLSENNLPLWKALLYMWGDEPPEFVVYFHNQPFPVRRNLYGFITRMVTDEQRE